MHSTRPVVDMIAHSSADQIITCGVGKNLIALLFILRFNIIIM